MFWGIFPPCFCPVETGENTRPLIVATGVVGVGMRVEINRPFARSGHIVRNKLCWDASYSVGLPKQRKVGLDWYEFLCFESPTA